MTALRRLIALAILACWLPATLHCSLEAAGVLPAHDESCCTDGQACADDNCGVVESGAFRSGGVSVQVNAPDILTCVCLLCPPLALLAPAELSLAASLIDRPLDWVPVWQFVRRAAPSPRAPSLV